MPSTSYSADSKCTETQRAVRFNWRTTAANRFAVLGIVLFLAASVVVAVQGAAAPHLVIVGQEETAIARGTWGLEWFPDGSIAFRRRGGELDVWVAGGVTDTGVRSTFLLRGPDFDHLTPHAIENGKALPVFTPSGAGFDRDYAGPGTVLPAANGSDLLMFYHAEDQTCDESKAKVGIGLARSSDGGVTWERQGQIISGRDPVSGCPVRFTGAGYPSAVYSPDGQYIYLYYMDWWNTNDLGSDAVHVARAPVASDGAPGAWLKFHDGGFNEPGLGGGSTPVIRRAEPVDSTVWIGNPNVSYNVRLNRYLAVLQSHIGFHYALSDDGLTWEAPLLLLAFPKSQGTLVSGDVWYSYASFISPDQQSQRLTGQDGYLYFSRGEWMVSSHYMVRRPLALLDAQVYLPQVSGGVQAATPTPTPSPTPTPPPGVTISAGGSFAPSPGWTWVCGGDFTVTQTNGATVELYDSDGDTGLVVVLPPDFAAELHAPWGGSCHAENGVYADALIDETVASMLDDGCTGGCARVNVQWLDAAGFTTVSEWRP